MSESIYTCRVPCRVHRKEHKLLGKHHFLNRFEVLLFTTNAPRTFWNTAPQLSSSRYPGLGLELIPHQTQNVIPVITHFFQLWHPCVSTFLKQSNSGSAQRSVSGDICESSLHPMLKEEKNEWVRVGASTQCVWTAHHCWWQWHPTDHLKQRKLHHTLRLS